MIVKIPLHDTSSHILERIFYSWGIRNFCVHRCAISCCTIYKRTEAAWIGYNNGEPYTISNTRFGLSL